MCASPDATRKARAEDIIKEVRRNSDKRRLMLDTAAALFKVERCALCVCVCNGFVPRRRFIALL